MKTSKGVEVSAKIKEQAVQMTEGLKGPAPKLAIMRAGEEPDDMSYERGVVKEMESFSLRARIYVSPEQTSDSDFETEFSTINRSPDVSGILLLRPLPKQIVETDIERMIDPEKDLGGILPANIARISAGDKTGFAPCTTETVVGVLEVNGIDTTGKNMTIVGRSMVVGRPLSIPMLKENATVTICHTRTGDLEAECRGAEILAAVVGKIKMLSDRRVGQDAIVINVGINVDKNGKIRGDVDLQSIESMVSIATPVPGGVRAVITAVLVKHLVLAG